MRLDADLASRPTGQITLSPIDSSSIRSCRLLRSDGNSLLDAEGRGQFAARTLEEAEEPSTLASEDGRESRRGLMNLSPIKDLECLLTLEGGLSIFTSSGQCGRFGGSLPSRRERSDDNP